MPVRPDPAQPRVWQRFVAIGDSSTEGMVDADPELPDESVGWVSMVDRVHPRVPQLGRFESVRPSMST